MKHMLATLVLLAGIASASARSGHVHSYLWDRAPYMRIATVTGTSTSAPINVDTSAYDMSEYIDSSGSQHVTIWVAVAIEKRGELPMALVSLREYMYTPGATYARITDVTLYFGEMPASDATTHTSSPEWKLVIPNTNDDFISRYALALNAYHHK